MESYRIAPNADVFREQSLTLECFHYFTIHWYCCQVTFTLNSENKENYFHLNYVNLEKSMKNVLSKFLIQKTIRNKN